MEERWRQLREIRYEIPGHSCGQKISSFLKTKGYSEQNLVNLKKDGQSIRVNGVCVHQNEVLLEGDVLTVQIRELNTSERIVPAELPLDIVYEDEDLMVVNKPAGMPVHPSRGNFDNSLGNALAWRCAQRGERFVFRCVNRLDRDTSGLTIVAKHMVSAAMLSRMVAGKAEEGGVRREYLAVVEGTPSPKKGTVCAPIARRESRCLEREVDFVRGDRAVTHYEVLEEYEDRSLVALVLETGRTHQIRVHMKYLGHPLLGDFLYHPRYAANQTDRIREEHIRDFLQKQSVYDIRRQALHAHRLSFRHPVTGDDIVLSVPMPEDMRALLRSRHVRPVKNFTGVG